MQNNHLQIKTSDLSEGLINNDLHRDTHSHLKIKPIFRQSMTWGYLFYSDLTSLNKEKPKMFSRITISNLRIEKNGRKGLRKLRKALVDSKRASSLRLDETNLNSKQLTYLFHSTNYWRKLSFQFQPSKFEKSAARFSRCKNLEFFALGEKEPRREEMPILPNLSRELSPRIPRQLKELKRVKTVVLNVPFSINAGMKAPKSLQNLHITFQENEYFSKEIEFFKLFPTFLSSLQRLEHLSLTFFNLYQIRALDVRTWGSFFQNTRSPIRKVTVKFYFSSQTQLIGSQTFIELLAHLKELTSLDLLFSTASVFGPLYTSPSDESISALSSNLRTIIKLEELKLRLTHLQVLKNNSLRELTIMLQSLKNLKDLQIHLPPLESSDEGFLSIAESLKGLIYLKTVDIRLPKANLSQKSLVLFSENLAHRQLTSLSLTCERYNCPDLEHLLGDSIIKSGIKKLVKLWRNNTLAPFFGNIGRFNQLSQLNLRLSLYDISIQEWKRFSLALSHLKELSSLELTLPEFNPKNNFEGLQNFLSCLQNLPKLASLNLAFKGKISDQEVGLLASHLAKCQGLTFLRVQFKIAYQVGDQSLYFLGSGIQNLRALENLQLEFWKEEAFGEKALAEFLKVLTVFKNLSMFLLYENALSNQQQKMVLPRNLKNFNQMKRLTKFVVNHHDYMSLENEYQFENIRF